MKWNIELKKEEVLKKLDILREKLGIEEIKA